MKNDKTKFESSQEVKKKNIHVQNHVESFLRKTR